jgi:hypothetical protein
MGLLRVVQAAGYQKGLEVTMVQPGRVGGVASSDYDAGVGTYWPAEVTAGRLGLRSGFINMVLLRGVP